jgi:hypothetical protein
MESSKSVVDGPLDESYITAANEEMTKLKEELQNREGK